MPLAEDRKTKPWPIWVLIFIKKSQDQYFTVIHTRSLKMSTPFI